MRLRIVAAAIAIVALALPASAAAAKGGEESEEVTVMSRNIYLGANLDPALGAPTLDEAVEGAGQIYHEIERTNFPERAVLLADEIKDAKADLVGVQEGALWQEQTPSDGGGPPITGGTPATTVKYDFLEILMANLPAKYRVVGVQNEFTGELPADTDSNNATGSPFGADVDIRLTMRDFIIARKNVDTSKVKSGNYTNRFSTSVGGVPVFADRGWVSTQAKVGDAKFRFVNTHLEAFGDPAIRAAQAQELVDGPAKSRKDVVLVGDMNSDKDYTNGHNAAYDVIRGAGFIPRQAKGGTSGHEESLTNPNDQGGFDRTIDFVFVNNKDIKLDKRKSEITGRDVGGPMSPSCLWASDHAGVLSTLEFPLG